MTTIIDIGLLSFSDDNYVTPPEVGGVYDFGDAGAVVEPTDCPNLWTDTVKDVWVDADEPSWTECWPGYLKEIYTDAHHIYVAHSYGLDIIDLSTEKKVAFVEHTYGFTTVAGNEDKVYLGTLADGIKVIDKVTISGTSDSPVDMVDHLNAFEFNSWTASRVAHLCVADNLISVTTKIGLDVIEMSNQPNISRTVEKEIIKSFLTENGEIYYIFRNGPLGDGIAKVDYYKCDWTFPENVYYVGSSFLSTGTLVNDLFVTCGDSNTMYVATSNGLYIVNEENGDYNLYRD